MTNKKTKVSKRNRPDVRSVIMDDELYERVRIASLRQGVKSGESVSMSEFIREAVESHLKGVER